MAKTNGINGKELKAKKSSKPLCKHTEDALNNYFASLNGDRPGDLYDLVMGEVERPLFKAVMEYTDGNQSQGRRHTRHQPRHLAKETQDLFPDSIS